MGRGAAGIQTGPTWDPGWVRTDTQDPDTRLLCWAQIMKFHLGACYCVRALPSDFVTVAGEDGQLVGVDSQFDVGCCSAPGSDVDKNTFPLQFTHHTLNS